MQLFEQLRALQLRYVRDCDLFLVFIIVVNLLIVRYCRGGGGIKKSNTILDAMLNIEYQLNFEFRRVPIL